MSEILMPALSPTMERGTLAKWCVAVGDTVRPGDVIAEIETDKASMEVEASEAGVIAALLVPAGTEDVLVQTPIARLAFTTLQRRSSVDCRKPRQPSSWPSPPPSASCSANAGKKLQNPSGSTGAWGSMRRLDSVPT